MLTATNVGLGTSRKMTSSLIVSLLLVTVTLLQQIDVTITSTASPTEAITSQETTEATTTTAQETATTDTMTATTNASTTSTNPTTPTATTDNKGTVSSSAMTSLATICASNENCTTLNSICQDDGTNTGVKRCVCKMGFVQYTGGNSKNTTYCGQMTSTFAHPNCSVCEANNGVCYLKSTDDSTQPGSSTQCMCPVSRSGVNCEISRVNVTCSGADMTMKICYSALSPVNFANGAWTMSTPKVHQSQCFGSTVEDTAKQWCGIGQQSLVLNLTDSQLAVCGTKIIADSMSKTYENTIVVQPTAADSDVAPITFVAYCTFELYQHETFTGLSVYTNNDNGEAGQTVTPKLSLKVVNQFSETIPFGVAVRVGDLVRFVMTLDTSGSPFSSVNVLFCTASTSGLMPDVNAITQPLITNGCPVSSAYSQWYWTKLPTGNNSLSAIQTDLIPAFMLSASPTLFIHCTVQVCLVGDNSCALKSSTDCKVNRKKRSTDEELVEHMTAGRQQQQWEGNFMEPSADSHRRLKRAVQQRPTLTAVSGQLNVYDPNGNRETSTTSADSLLSTSSGLIAFIGVLVFIIIVLVTMGSVVAYQYKRRQLMTDHYQLQSSYHPDSAPQRFAVKRLYPRTVAYSRF